MSRIKHHVFWNTPFSIYVRNHKRAAVKDSTLSGCWNPQAWIFGTPSPCAETCQGPLILQRLSALSYLKGASKKTQHKILSSGPLILMNFCSQITAIRLGTYTIWDGGGILTALACSFLPVIKYFHTGQRGSYRFTAPIPIYFWH